MGWNTTLMINNDLLHEIKEDPEFGRKVYEAAAARVTSGEPVRFRGGYVIATGHNSGVCVTMTGGNCGSVLGWGIGTDGRHLQPEHREKILRQLADDMGFKLVRKKPLPKAPKGPSPKCDQCISLGKNSAKHPAPTEDPCFLCGHRCEEPDCCKGVI